MVLCVYIVLCWVRLELARTIMQGIALALGGPRDLFEGERAGDPFWIFRVIGYPPINISNHDPDTNGLEIGWYDVPILSPASVMLSSFMSRRCSVKRQSHHFACSHSVLHSACLKFLL